MADGDIYLTQIEHWQTNYEKKHLPFFDFSLIIVIFITEFLSKPLKSLKPISLKKRT